SCIRVADEKISAAANRTAQHDGADPTEQHAPQATAGPCFLLINVHFLSRRRTRQAQGLTSVFKYAVPKLVAGRLTVGPGTRRPRRWMLKMREPGSVKMQKRARAEACRPLARVTCCVPQFVAYT